MTDANMESWAMFYLNQPIELDWSAFTDSLCEPVPLYELYVNINGEYISWKKIWNEFSESYPGVKSYISSHFYF